MDNIVDMNPGSAQQWLDLGFSLRRRAQFGEAINAFNSAIESVDAQWEKASGQERLVLSDIKKKSLASIGLIQEINGFVNVDLMNP